MQVKIPSLSDSSTVSLLSRSRSTTPLVAAVRHLSYKILVNAGIYKKKISSNIYSKCERTFLEKENLNRNKINLRRKYSYSLCR